MAQTGYNSVKDRLARMQRQNFRSIPAKEKPVEKQSVKKEIEELKFNSMIKAESDVPVLDSRIKERLLTLDSRVVIGKREEPKTEEIYRENPNLDRIKVAIQRLEDIKRKMAKTDNFLGLYYDLNKAEKEMLDALNEVKSAGIELPSSMNMRLQSLMPRKIRD